MRPFLMRSFARAEIKGNGESVRVLARAVPKTSLETAT